MKFLALAVLMLSTQVVNAAKPDMVLCQSTPIKMTAQYHANFSLPRKFLLADAAPARVLTYIQAGITPIDPNSQIHGYTRFINVQYIGGVISGSVRGKSPVVSSSGTTALFSNSDLTIKIVCKPHASNDYYFSLNDGQIITTEVSPEGEYGNTLFVDNALEDSGMCVVGDLAAAVAALKADKDFEPKDSVRISRLGGISWVRPKCLERQLDPLDDEGMRQPCIRFETATPGSSVVVSTLHRIPVCTN